jgi:predicted secreted protein
MTPDSIFMGMLVFMIVIPAGCIAQDHSINNRVSAQCEGMSSNGENVTLNEMQNNSTICAMSNSSFKLHLKENSRTGYQWKIGSSPGLEVVDEGVTWFNGNGTPTTIPGIQGVHSWSIAANGTGIQTIKGVLRRPESSSGFEQLFNLIIIVE